MSDNFWDILYYQRVKTNIENLHISFSSFCPQTDVLLLILIPYILVSSGDEINFPIMRREGEFGEHRTLAALQCHTLRLQLHVAVERLVRTQKKSNFVL